MTNKLIPILMLLLLGCGQKEDVNINYPYIELSSFESLDKIQEKVLLLTGTKCNITDDWDTKSCRFEYTDKDSINSQCYLEFDENEELIWFQCWYRTTNGDLDHLHKWFSEYYQCDTIENKSGELVKFIRGISTIQIRKPQQGVKVLYYGQFFTEDIPLGDQ